MFVIICISICFMILLTISCITACFCSNQKKKEDSFDSIKIIKADNRLWQIGLGCGCFFLAIAILAFLQKESWYVIGICIAFIWLGNFLMYGWLGMVISYDRKGFTVGWFPRIRKYYSYQQLTAYRVSEKGMILKAGKKKISLEYMIDEHYEFQWYALTQYKKEYETDLPLDTSIPKWDIFKGNIHSPEEILIMYGILILFVIGGMCYCMLVTHEKVEREDTIHLESKVSSYYLEDSSLILYLEQYDGNYRISRMNVQKKAKLFIAISEDKTFKIYMRQIGEPDKNLYEIYQIEDQQGEIYLSFEEAHEFNKEFGKQLNLILFIMMAPLLFMLIIPTILIGRNPHKYSQKVKNAFFQEYIWR